MAKYEVSSNVIDQLQILLNKEAGVESFTSNDRYHSLHSLPSSSPSSSSSSSFLNDAIAIRSSSSNSSIDALRCSNCGGELLRGSNSIICVYCGHSPNHDLIPQPLSFKSTLAFQWFLQSLGLDGFESVGTGTSLGGTQVSDRGRSSNKEDEILVSEFVDLQLQWPDNEVGVNNEEGFSGKRYLRLVGVDVEEILSQDSRDHGSSDSNEVGVATQKNEYEETRTTGEGSLSLFQNVQSFEVALRSSEGENDESFSDWGTEFQTAIPDPVCGKSGNVAMFDAASGGNLTTTSNKLSSKFEYRPPFVSKLSDGNNLVEGGGKAFDSVNCSFDCWPADQQHTINEDSANSEKRDGDDSFDEWGDFRMSTGDKITQSEPSGTAAPGTDSSDGLVISDLSNKSAESVVSNNIQLQNNSFSVPDDAWNNYATSSTGGDHQSQIISDKPEQHAGTGVTALGGEIDLTLFDGTNLQHQGINAESKQSKIFDQGDPIGLWSNDMHFDVKGDKLQGRESKSPASGSTNEFDNSFDLWNNIKGSDKQQATENKIPTEAGSTFDAWNDLAGLGVGKKEEIDSSLEILGEKESSNQSDSLGLWNDKPLDAWSSFTGFANVSVSKPITNVISPGGWNDFPSLMVTHEKQPQSSNTRISEDKVVLEDDNLFVSWSDFRSFGVQTETSLLGPNDTKTSSDEISFQKATSSRILVEDNSISSSWGDLGGAPSVEQQLQGATVGSSENKLSSGGDFFSGLSDKGKQSASLPDNEVQCEGATMFDGTFTCENEDSFDAWTEFTSSGKAQVNPSTSYAPDANSDVFDAWNVTNSSPNVRASKEMAVAIGKTPEINSLDLSDHSQYVAPNSSMHPDLCVGMFNKQNDSAPVALSTPEVPDLVRKEHGDVKADCYDDRMNPSESALKEALDLKSSVAETLISEMHDLSFMLESGLSISGSGR